MKTISSSTETLLQHPEIRRKLRQLRRRMDEVRDREPKDLKLVDSVEVNGEKFRVRHLEPSS